MTNKPARKMDILKFLNIYNIEHLKAYRILDKTGCWPEKFIPENVTFRAGWQIMLAGKMATAWANHNHLGIDVEKV